MIASILRSEISASFGLTETYEKSATAPTRNDAGRDQLVRSFKEKRELISAQSVRQKIGF